MYRHQVFRFNVHDQLPKSKSASLTYLENLSGLLGDKRQEPLFDHLYENLSILDAKSASLLQFNSILVAVFAIFLSSGIATLPFYVAVSGILSTLVSSYLLLEVVWVHWTKVDDASKESHVLRLLEVMKSRTVLYRIAWNFSKGSLLAVVAVVVLIAGIRLL